MSTRWVKVIRDMQVARGRLAMIVGALSVSLAAVMTMLTAWTVLRREVPRSYIDSNPASAQVAVDGVLDSATLDAVRGLPNIAAAAAGATQLARIEVGHGDWLPMLLFIVPDFTSLTINTLHPESGQWPAPDGAILIERSALQLVNAPVGGMLSVQLPGAGRRTLTLAGTVHDPGVAPAWQEQTVYGYVTPRTLAALGDTVRLDLLKLIVRDGADDGDVIESTVRDLAPRLAALGIAPLDARIPPPRRHPHQSQMNAVLTMLLAFSLLVLVLGAILTAAVISGMLAQQVRQIAIMKAIGARSAQIAALYLSLVALLALLALLIGLPLGHMIGQSLIGAVGVLLNLRLASTVVPLWVFALLAALGVVMPLIAAAVPVQRAVRRTVCDAINDYGNQPSSADATIVRALGGLRSTNPSITMALRNTFRRRGRLVLTASLLAGAGAMCIASLDLKAAWERNVSVAREDRHFDAEIWLAQSAPVGEVMRLASAVSGVARAEPWASSGASRSAHDNGLEIARSYPDGVHGGFSLRAAPADTRLVEHHLTEGRWLVPGDSDATVVNSLARLTAFHAIRLGDTVTVNVEHRSTRLRVVGVIREPLTPGAAFVTPQTFDRATGRRGTTNNLRLQFATGQPSGDVTRALVTALEQAGIGVRVVISEARFGSAQGGHVYILVFALAFIAVVMALVGLIGLASSLGVSVLERTREFAVMRAIGGTSRMILATVITEGALIATLSIVVAVVASRVLSEIVGRVLAAIASQELTLRLTPSSVAVWGVGLLVSAIVVSCIPARRAAQLTVRDALSHI